MAGCGGCRSVPTGEPDGSRSGRRSSSETDVATTRWARGERRPCAAWGEPPRGMACAVPRLAGHCGCSAHGRCGQPGPEAGVFPVDRDDVRSHRSRPASLRPAGPHVWRERSGAGRLRRRRAVYACRHQAAAGADRHPGCSSGGRLGDEPGRHTAGRPHHPARHDADGRPRGRADGRVCGWG